MHFPGSPAEDPLNSVHGSSVQSSAGAATAADRVPQRIADAIRRGATVLTAHRVQAQRLAGAFAKSQRSSGVARWSPPAILPLDAFAAGLWHRAVLAGEAERVLLNRSQEHALWLQIIEADPQVSALRSLDALAALAANAAETLALHQGRPQLGQANQSTDTRAFEQWTRAFERETARHGYLPKAQLPGALESLLASGLLEVPEAGLVLVDFFELPPAYASLLDAIERAGYPVETIHTAASAPLPALLYEAANVQEEYHAAADWARAILEETPDARIAIVSPSLAQDRVALDRVFEAVLAPQLADAAARDAGERAPYAFVDGEPLSRVHAAETALNLLTLAQHGLSLEAASRLLLSPAFGSGAPAEALAVAEFDAHELRTAPALRPDLTLAGLLRLVRRSRRLPRMGTLFERLTGIERVASAEALASARTRSPAEWAESFRAVLRVAGWAQVSAAGVDSPRETTRSRDLHFQQVRRQLDSALDELATLGFNGSRCTAAAALRLFTRIVAQSAVRPGSFQGTDPAPIEILSPADLGGVPFDALWFLSAGNVTWPTLPSPNPLLPRALLRALGVPGVDAARDQDRTARLTERIAVSATQSVFSFAAQWAEGHQLLSPAVAALRLEPMALQPHSPAAPLRLLAVEDDPSLPPLPPRESHGGSEILALQVACPFRAFAEKRLASSEPDARTAGLDAGERGNIVHKVMEHFWTTVETQARLLSMSADEVRQTLTAAIDAALAQTRSFERTSWDRAYVDTQAARLHGLLEPWLELEASRPEFRVLAREETSEPVSFGPLRLRVRIDRTDETKDGPLILDYKTGSADPADWRSDRPEAPQLPLYAVLSPRPVAGVAFALLRAGDELKMKGFADDSGVFGKVAKMDAATMAEQVDQWREILEGLAEDFAKGASQVSPKTYPETCKFCTQRILCRLDPSTLAVCEEEEIFSGQAD